MRRRRLGIGALVTTVIIGVALAFTTFGGASASPGGPPPFALSATNGTKTLAWQGGRSLALDVAASGGAWSGDGSRLAFVGPDNAIDTVRFDDGSDIGSYAPADSTVKSHPTWVWNVTSGFPLWSAHVVDPGVGASDVIQFARRDGGPVETIPLPASMNWTSPDAGIDQIVVQGQQGATDAGVYAFDASDIGSASATPTLVVGNATEPSAAPDSERVAFRRDDANGHAQIWVVNLPPAGPGTPVQITADAVDHSHPTWSPDGETVAFDEGSAVFTAAADGSQSTKPVAVPGLDGVPAYELSGSSVGERLAGANRYQTAVAISAATWDRVGSAGPLPAAHAVVLARGDSFADALAGSALAVAKVGPLLLTPPGSLNPDTAGEISRIGGGTTKTVYLLGGTGAISSHVEQQVQALHVKTVRIAGPDRYTTAILVAKAISPDPHAVFVATGLDFPDALSAGAAAGSFDRLGSADPAVVVLTAGNALPAASKNYIDGLRSLASPPALYGVGGPAVTALGSAQEPITHAIVGQDRYDTALKVASLLDDDTSTFGVATGTNWPDALAGGALLGFDDAPLLLTPPTRTNAEVTTYLDRNSAGYASELVFGQTAVVATSVMNAYLTATSGPSGIVATAQ